MGPIARALHHANRVPDRRPIYTWAGENVEIPQGVYTVSGFFDVSISRYLIKPFEAFQSDTVRKITLQWPTRAAKSLFADICLMWCIDQGSGPTMFNFNTDPQARRHFQTRLKPLMLGTKCLAALLPEDGRKLTQDVIFRDGNPLYVQGPALDNVQGLGICNLFEDELWRRATGRHEQALSRLGDYEKLGMDKNVNLGQGGFEGDDQDLEFCAGSQEEWFGACLYCGHKQEPAFGGFRADGSRFGLRFGEGGARGATRPTKDKHGDWILSEVLPTIRWECAKCGKAHVDERRTKANWNRGDYAVTNEQAAKLPAGDGARGATRPTNAEFINRSFHVSSTFTKPWVNTVTKFCLAMNQLRMGNLDPLILFTQKEEARSWSEQRFLSAKPTPTYELTSEAWPEAVYRFITIDRQAEGVMWLLIFDASQRGEMRPLWFGRVFSEAEIIKKATEFKVRENNVLIDARFEGKLVYAMCVRNGWIALKGDARESFTHRVKRRDGTMMAVERSYSRKSRGDPEIGTVHQGRRFAPLIWWSNPTIKNRFHRQRDRGLVVFPAGPNGEELEWVKELKTQIAGEWKKRIKNQITGKFKEVWCDNGNNHGADCCFMGTLGLTLAKVLPDDPAAELEAGCEAVVTE